VVKEWVKEWIKKRLKERLKERLIVTFIYIFFIITNFFNRLKKKLVEQTMLKLRQLGFYIIRIDLLPDLVKTYLCNNRFYTYVVVISTKLIYN
jgi:hypothetical protein